MALSRVFEVYRFRCPAVTLLVAVTLLASLAGAQDQTPDTHPSSTISGTVVNSVTREPIGRALVYTADERYAALTDDHGHFELTVAEQPSAPGVVGMSTAQNILQVRKPGFLKIAGPRAGTSAVPGQSDLTLKLIPEGLIVGRVKFPSAEAADRVQVALYRREVREGFARWEQSAQTTTRADGEFRFADLRAGEYKLFSLESTERDPLTAVPNGPVFGFPPRYFAAARDFASADTVHVNAGESFTTEIAPERLKYYDVRVPVVSADPNPPRGIQVSVYAQGHRGPGFALGYDPNQRAIRGSLPNGTYTVEATSFQPGAATGVANITVANGPVNAPPLTMAPNVSIEINVRQDLPAGDNPAAASSPYVTLESAEDVTLENGSRDTYQSDNNPPVLAGVGPGRYWVEVHPTASGMYAASVASAGKDLLRTPLVVPYGASVAPIDITVRYDSAEIDATLEGAANGSAARAVVSTGRSNRFQPGTGPSVYCIPLDSDGGVAREFSPQFDGTYVLPQLPPGEYRILAFDTPQELEYRNPAAMRAYESKGQVVHVTPGQKLQVQLQPIKSE